MASDAEGRTPISIASNADVLDVFSGEKRNAKDKTTMPVIKTFLENWAAKKRTSSDRIGKIQYFKGLDAQLPAHVVAPELVLTPTGYCPKEDGKVKQLPRGIRFAKRRKGPSSPKCRVNWYAPRG